MKQLLRLFRSSGTRLMLKMTWLLLGLVWLWHTAQPFLIRAMFQLHGRTAPQDICRKIPGCQAFTIQPVWDDEEKNWLALVQVRMLPGVKAPDDNTVAALIQETADRDHLVLPDLFAGRFVVFTDSRMPPGADGAS